MKRLEELVIEIECDSEYNFWAYENGSGVQNKSRVEMLLSIVTDTGVLSLEELNLFTDKLNDLMEGY